MLSSHLGPDAGAIFYRLHINEATGLQRRLNPAARVARSASLSLHVPPAAKLLVLPVTFQQIPLVSLQPEVICSVLDHKQHSKHFQNGANCRLSITSLML